MGKRRDEDRESVNSALLMYLCGMGMGAYLGWYYGQQWERKAAQEPAIQADLAKRIHKLEASTLANKEA